MKIWYNVIVADDFTFDRLPLWPVPVGNVQHFPSLEIEFTPTSRDHLKDADKALAEYMKRTHPSQQYKIYYWHWECDLETKG